MTKQLHLVTAVALFAGCGQDASPPEAEPVAEPPAASPAQDDACQPHQELARLDNRRAVPLMPMMAWHQKQNMMEHLVAIQRITDGVARQDWEAVATASALIETSPQMQRMCQHMGAGAEGFTEMALDFHSRADAIGVAARAQDGAAVLHETARTLEACTSCHATYRQEIVDQQTWQARTGSDHNPAMMH